MGLENSIPSGMERRQVLGSQEQIRKTVIFKKPCDQSEKSISSFGRLLFLGVGLEITLT